MSYHALAEELNQILSQASPSLFGMLSEFGKRLYFPRGIVTQSNEAKAHAKLFNATIGIATENGKPMNLPVVRSLISEQIPDQDIFPYAPTPGLLALRQAWAIRQKTENPSIKSDISSPVVTSALTQGLSLIGDLFLDPSDPILMPDQNWDNYRFIWEGRHQAKISTFPFFNAERNAFNKIAFQEALSAYEGKKLLLLLNFPNNPTGYSLTIEEARWILRTITDAAQKGTHLVAVCDDAYFGMVYEEGIKRESLFGELAEAHENIVAIKVDGCTKEAFMWGFRVGFLTVGWKGGTRTSYDAFEKKLAGSIRAQVSTNSHLGQSILLRALQSPEFFKEQAAKVEILRQRYEETKRVVYAPQWKDLWDVYPFNSGYFMCLRLKNGVNPEELRLKLLHEEGLGVISLGTSDIRVAFSCLEVSQIAPVFELIAEGCRRLFT